MYDADVELVLESDTVAEPEGDMPAEVVRVEDTESDADEEDERVVEGDADVVADDDNDFDVEGDSDAVAVFVRLTEVEGDPERLEEGEDDADNVDVDVVDSGNVCEAVTEAVNEEDWAASGERRRHEVDT